MVAELKINGEVLAGDLPAVEGIHDVSLGDERIKIALLLDGRMGSKAIIDCSQCPSLQGRREKKERVINLGRSGKGKQYISESEVLEYNLGVPISERGHAEQPKRGKNRVKGKLDSSDGVW